MSSFIAIPNGYFITSSLVVAPLSGNEDRSPEIEIEIEIEIEFN